MRTSLARKFKKLLMLFAAAAVLCLGQDVALADELTIAGSTQGSLACPDPFSICPVSNFTFIPTPTMQFSASVPQGGGGAVILGTIALTGDLSSFHGNQLSLTVTFTQPSGIAGSTGSFSSTFTGTFSLEEDLEGRTQLNLFFGDPILLNFGNGGSFVFGIANLENVGAGATLIGIISNVNLPPPVTAPIPEPATLILLTTGLAGAAGAARRRRRGRGGAA